VRTFDPAHFEERFMHKTRLPDLTARRIETTRASPRALRAVATGALAVGGFALGAISVGAMAIGALAIGRVAVGRVRIGKLEIDELSVRRLVVTEELHAPQGKGG